MGKEEVEVEVGVQCPHLRNAAQGPICTSISIQLPATKRLKITSQTRAAIALHTTPFTMRLRIIGLLLGLLSIVSALSATGSKLLVILEEESEKNKYSEFWADLESEHSSSKPLDYDVFRSIRLTISTQTEVSK